jgi:hypothetical protein
MQMMLETNPGLKSRFTGTLHFDDFDAKTIVELIKMSHGDSSKLALADDITDDALLDIAMELASINQFSNGRDVDTLCKAAYREVAKRKSRAKEVRLTDLQAALQQLVEERNAGAVALASAPQRGHGGVAPRAAPAQAAASAAPAPRPRVSTRTAAATASSAASADPPEAVDDDVDVDLGGEEEQGSNPFENIDKRKLQTLQDILNELNLNSEEGIRRVPSMTGAIAKLLAERLGCSLDEATAHLTEWQNARDEAEEQLKKQKMKMKISKVEAIWHCAACGAGGYPTPVCYYAPYISGYRKRE